MSEFFRDDGLQGVFGITPSSVIDSMKKDQVITLLKSLGATSIVDQGTHLILPTICHNPRESEKSPKLYYYFDSKLFSCYTECGHAFNIYELVRKVHEINDHAISFYEAYNYVLNYVGSNIYIEPPEIEFVNNRYVRKLSVEDLPAYNNNALSIFPIIPPTEWLNEGISAQAMKKFDIRLSAPKLKIIIPHYDLKGRLVGIRGRALDEYEIEHYGKYMPVKIENIFYTHHLSRNLYGAYVNQSAIRRTKKAVLFEGEKSCLKMTDFYGNDSIAVAVCGSNLHKIQVDILVKELGVSEIVIAFDKEYDSLHTAEAETYKYKLINLAKKFRNYANFSFIYDMENLLDPKDSPVDKGKEIYERLYNLRVKIR